MDNLTSVVELKNKLHQRIEEFLRKMYDDFYDEFSAFISQINPELGLIDKVSAQRLLVRSVTYQFVKKIIQEQLPEELQELDDAEPSVENSSIVTN